MRNLVPAIILVLSVILAACAPVPPTAAAPASAVPPTQRPAPTATISPTATSARNCTPKAPCDLTSEELRSLSGTIVFVRNLQGRDNESSIELMHLPDTSLTPLVKVKNLANVALSPSGKRLAYSVLDDITKTDVKPAIYVINTDGTRQGALYVPYYPHTYSPYTFYGHAPYGLPGMSWSPDERKIAFACVDDLKSNAPRSGICVYYLDDMSLKMIYKAESPLMVLMPMWSPDGGKIAFVKNLNPPSEKAKLAYFLIKPDGSGLVNLTENLLVDIDQKSAPGWSPDGKALMFLTDFTRPNNQRELVSVDENGQVLHRVAWKVDANIAGFSPDGNWLITHEGMSSDPNRIVITVVNGLAAKMIAEKGFLVGWSK